LSSKKTHKQVFLLQGIKSSAVKWLCIEAGASMNLAFQNHLWEGATQPDILVRVRGRVVQVQNEAPVLSAVVPITADNRTASGRPPGKPMA